MTSYRTGLRAELFAKAYMRLKGYRVLAERYKTPVGEIDLVLKKGSSLIFMEVKLRQSSDAAAEAIHAQNRARVTRAATLYLQKHIEYTSWELRFDALVLAPFAWPRHIQNAW